MWALKRESRAFYGFRGAVGGRLCTNLLVLYLFHLYNFLRIPSILHQQVGPYPAVTQTCVHQQTFWPVFKLSCYQIAALFKCQSVDGQNDWVFVLSGK